MYSKGSVFSCALFVSSLFACHVDCLRLVSSALLLMSSLSNSFLALILLMETFDKNELTSVIVI